MSIHDETWDRNKDTNEEPVQAEADTIVSGWLHRLVQPFLRDKTGDWRARQRVTTLIETIKNAATEAEECLEKDELGNRKLMQAQVALNDLEKAWVELRGSSCSPSFVTKRGIGGHGSGSPL